ncbi:MAG: hypothetical protein FJ096_09390 [Deltaproteobacteria bacterium]|nr:hypothetical protein [Deltaproteobacteria bacterium]
MISRPLRAANKALGLIRLGDDLMQFSFPEGLHNEDSWAGRIHVPFQYFFGRAWSAGR